MGNPFDSDAGEFLVLVNAEGQHSLWPSFRTPPSGWNVAEIRGSRLACLAWIEEHWTDMRPSSGRVP
jgi:MbtH protein